jgi:hypothetical protein
MERVSLDIGIPLGSGTLTLIGWMQAGNRCLKGSKADDIVEEIAPRK